MLSSACVLVFFIVQCGVYRSTFTMPSYFFPCLIVVPEFEEPTLDCGCVVIHRRLWGTSVYDLATLAVKHKLHLPYQLMDIFLGHCNLEIEVRSSGGIDDAVKTLHLVRALMYLRGIIPFIVPYGATHSINDYSGINEREAEHLREKLPAELRDRFTSKTEILEAWPVELTLTIIGLAGSHGVNKTVLSGISEDLEKLMNVEKEFPVVSVARRILTTVT